MNHGRPCIDDVWIERQPAVTVVQLGAEYGSTNFQRLCDVRQGLLQLAAEVDPRQLLIDFWNTDYFGAGLINVLLRCHESIRRRNGRLVMCRMQPMLREEVKQTRLDQLWPIYDLRDEALAAMIPTDGQE